MPLRRKPRKKQPRKTTESFNIEAWNRTHLALLVIFTILALYLRIEPALFDTVHFGYDQGVDMSYVRNLVVERKLSLISRFTGLQGVFMGPLWTWILAVPYVISGGSPTANELFFSGLGILAVWLSYALVRRIAGETQAIIAAFFVAFSGPFIAVAHIVLSPHPLAILMIPYLWFLWEIIENNNQRFWPWLGLFAGAFFQFEIGFAVFLLPATVLVLGAFGRLKPFFTKTRMLAVAFFLLPFLPQILFEFRHQFLMSKAVLATLSGANESLGTEGVGILHRLLIRLGSLREDYLGTVSLKGENFWLTLLVSIPALAGWRILHKDREMRSLRLGAMLILLVLLMYTGFVVYPGPVWVWYRAGVPFIFVLLISIGWAEVVRDSQRRKWVAAIFFTALALVSINPIEKITRLVEGVQGGVGSVKNLKLALDTVFLDTQEEPFDLYVYTPPVYTYVWDHMLFWYAKPKFENHPEDYGYRRDENAKNDFYLLIEPDDLKSRIAGWKGNFESAGVNTETRQLPGGITFEKWVSKSNEQDAKL